MPVTLRTDNPKLDAKFRQALSGLSANVRAVREGAPPVLIEGAEYGGIWLECGPMEGLVYAPIDPAVALNNHRIFFAHQREDGYLPCYIWPDRLGSAQIQMVVPIAATAWETWEWTGDREFLREAYEACSRWDAWLWRYRNTRGLGLCEAFCEYDTGHDNSPRCEGLPRQCPDDDARKCVVHPRLPYLAPDLTASVWGGRMALARMAAELGEKEAPVRWLVRAAETRRSLMAHCWHEEHAAFYDRDAEGAFVQVLGDATLRVLGERVVDPPVFEKIYARHVHNPEEFWTPYPFPSIAASDPKFDRAFPVNSWAGAAQALTALRAPRWMEHYGKTADLVHLCRRWVRALLAADGFCQQIDPFTGRTIASVEGYSPAMLVLVDHVSRLHGVVRQGDELWWTCLLPDGARECDFTLDAPGLTARLVQREGKSELFLDGKPIACSDIPQRLITDLSGRPKRTVPLVSPSDASQPTGLS